MVEKTTVTVGSSIVCYDGIKFERVAGVIVGVVGDAEELGNVVNPDSFGCASHMRKYQVHSWFVIVVVIDVICLILCISNADSIIGRNNGGLEESRGMNCN